MEEFSSPNLELVLGVKEGTNFDRVQKPTIIIATLNGQSLESKKIQPDSNPQYTTDLTWDTDKSALRKMRCNQTPIKVECYAVNENGSREKLGYILLSVRCAQIIHKDKESTIKTNWHNILGVRNDFSSCKPKLLLYLIIREKEDTEIHKDLEYENLHNTTYTRPKIKPVRLQEEHLIQLGPLDTCCDIFLLSINAFAFENLHQIVIPEHKENGNNNFNIVYNIFDNLIRLKPFRIDSDNMILNEKSFFSIRTSLPILINYMNVYPHFFVRLKHNNITLSQAEVDLSSLVNADTVQEFLKMNKNATSSIDYDCILKNGFSKESGGDYRRDEEINKYCSLKLHIKFQYIESKDYSNEKGFTTKSIKYDNMLLTNQQNYLEGQINNCNKHLLLSTHRSVADTDKNNSKAQAWEKLVHFNENYQTCNSKSTLCNILHQSKENPPKITEVYKNYTLTVNLSSIEFLESKPDIKNVEIRFYHPQGELLTAFSNNVSIVAGQTINLKDVKCKVHFISTADEIKRLLTLFIPKINICDATSEEIKCISQISLNVKQLLSQDKMEYQYKSPLTDCQNSEEIGSADVSIALENRNESKPNQPQDKIPETILDNGFIYKIVDELETWKERQKEIFKNELRKKEQAHLTLLNEEWQRRRECLESKLACSVQQCKILADNLNKTTENLRMRKIQSLEKETKLIKENEELQWKYDRKLHQLQEALQKMQSDYSSKLIHLEEQNHSLINQVEALHEKNLELDKIRITQAEQLEVNKKGSLSQDQTTSVLQQLKNLEEKLDNAQKSKTFFKEQWGNAVKEIHRIKMESHHALHSQIKSSKEELNNLDLEEILHADSAALSYDRIALNEIQREIDTMNPESTLSFHRTIANEQLFVPNSNLSMNLDQHLRQSDSSVSSSSSDRRLQMLMDERDSLLKSGACTSEDNVIMKLNSEIRSILMNS